MGLPAKKLLSYDDYLALELETGVRHEFLDGYAVAMEGGTPRHSSLKTRLGGHAWLALGSGPCQPFDSDLKVRVLESGFTTYPDLSIVCGDLERHPEDKNAVTNPSVLFEVLSPGTERHDRGEKFRQYRKIASLTHYVLVSTEGAHIEVFSRDAEGQWSLRDVDSVLELPDIGLSIEVAQLYEGLPEEPSDD